ncbi:FkbM family methyltransferase [Rhabdochromatium marinum]|uniref:FkbM family methyltransferase n=1 Tax=Rhabdochromatium marinum TaxID=48729 RepID=UPI001907D4C0|nr:FkbM family methyltransferase [Rhabdochromatium marinum]
MPELALELKTALLLKEEGRHQEAENQCRQLLQRAPDDAEGHYVLGTLLLEQQRAEEALVEFQQALTLAPANGDYWLAFTEALLALGRSREALEIIDDMIAKGLDWPQALALQERAKAAVQRAADQPTSPAVAAEPDPTHWTLTIADDVRVCVPPDARLMTPYILLEQEDWFEAELPFLRQLIEPGMGVLDIGANHGLYALSLAKRLQGQGRVIACEPASAPADMLERSIAENGFGEVLTLLRLGLSDHEGSAMLNIGANSELNSLTPAADQPVDQTTGETETVRLTTLDALMQSSDWPDGWQVDILKLDAEGEEIRILQGAARFFAEQDPLVLFEWKHGQVPNTGLLETFAALGLDRYRLVPGLNALVSVAENEPLDGYQLNLFACTPARAERLAAAGYLIGAASAILEPAPAPNQSWPQALVARSFVSGLQADGQIITAWRALDRTGDPHWPVYEKALNAYLSASDPSQPLPARWVWLRASQSALAQLIAAGDTHLATRLLHIRVLDACGQRSAAVKANTELEQRLEQTPSARFDLPDRPFLPPLPDYDHRLPQGSIDAWIQATICEGLECRRAYSSYFHRDGRLLQRLADNPNRSLVMDRRRVLIVLLLALVAGRRVQLSAESPLRGPEMMPEHRNVEWWRGLPVLGLQQAENVSPICRTPDRHSYRAVFCAGMQRSGSTWSYNVARLILSRSVGEKSLEAGYVGGGDPLDRLLGSRMKQGQLRLLKFHRATPQSLGYATLGLGKVVFTYRPPLNAVASIADFFGTSIENAVATIAANIQDMNLWVRTGHALLISFDDLTLRSSEWISRMAAFLSVDLTAEDVAQIQQETAYERVKQKAEALGQQRESLIKAGSSAYDSQSLLHVGHAPLGRARDWRTQLTPEQQSYALKHLDRWVDADGQWRPDALYN